MFDYSSTQVETHGIAVRLKGVDTRKHTESLRKARTSDIFCGLSTMGTHDLRRRWKLTAIAEKPAEI